MRWFTFEKQVWVPEPITDVFEFFANAENLETITPPWLHFSIVTPTPITMHVGAEIDQPFNVLAVFFQDVSVSDRAAAGAKRVSLGSALNWASINPLLIASKEMLEKGTFNWMASMASRKEVEKLRSQA